MGRIERLKEYAAMKGPAGESNERNIDYWSNRASDNSHIAPRATDKAMTLPSTGKVALRDTKMQPYRSRKVDAALDTAKADINHVGSMYMRNVRRDA